MNVYELVERLNGEIVSNKAQVLVDGKHIIVGVVGETELELTPEGAELAISLEGVPKKRSRKSAASADAGVSPEDGGSTEVGSTPEADESAGTE